LEDATNAKNKMNGKEIDGKEVSDNGRLTFVVL
jgi:hypothetical protein